MTPAVPRVSKPVGQGEPRHGLVDALQPAHGTGFGLFHFSRQKQARQSRRDRET